MSQDPLHRAVAILSDEFGIRSFSAPGRWATLVEIVLTGGSATKYREPVAELCRESQFGSPSSTAQGTAEELASLLDGIPRSRQRVPVLKRLAAWWLVAFGDETEAAWDAAPEAYRDELRGIRGVGLELADRILLFVGNFQVYPLDRASLRIVCRHGWLGPEAEYDEWQSLFVGGLRESGVDLREFSAWAGEIGARYCGVTAKCDECPLKPLLPRGGPIEPE